MAQGDIHPQGKIASVLEYLAGKYARIVAMVVQYNSSPDALTNGQSGVAQGDNQGALVVNPKPLSSTIDSVESVPTGTTPSNKTASTNAIRTGAGILVGMYVNSTSSGTIKIYDSLTQTGTVLNNTITPAAGYHSLGNANFSTGLSITIGATLDVTLYYIPITST